MSQNFTFQDFYTHKIDDLMLSEGLKTDQKRAWHSNFKK